ncbi:MAG: hypothetical protein AAF568_08610 [Pseudomonadota bacterium]
MGAGGQSLAALIEEAYEVFKRPRPTDLGVCDCCMDPKIMDRFLDWPVRQIPVGDLRDWYFGAADLKGMPQATLRWLAPRILELFAKGEDIASVGPEVVLQRFAYAGFPDAWTRAEVDVVERYATEFLRCFLAYPAFRARCEGDLDTYLCALMASGIRANGLIEVLDTAQTADIVAATGEMHQLFWDAFWEHSPARRQLQSWYLSEAFLDRLMRFADCETAPEALRHGALKIGDNILEWRDMGYR